MMTDEAISANSAEHIFRFGTFDDLLKKLKTDISILGCTVRIKAPICEDDFVDRGMICHFVDLGATRDKECHNLYLFFGHHEDVNRKFFKRDYKSSMDKTKLSTALENGQYTPEYSVLVDPTDKISTYLQYMK